MTRDELSKALEKRRAELAEYYADNNFCPLSEHIYAQDTERKSFINTYGAGHDSLVEKVLDLHDALERAKFDLDMAIESKTGINVVASRLIQEALEKLYGELKGEVK